MCSGQPCSYYFFKRKYSHFGGILGNNSEKTKKEGKTGKQIVAFMEEEACMNEGF